MPDHFFIMPGFMLDLKERISCCLFVIFVMINEALRFFFTSFGNHMKCILIKYLIKTTIFFIKTTIFVAILYIKSSARDKTGTMGVQQMQLLRRHSFIIIIIIVVVVSH